MKIDEDKKYPTLEKIVKVILTIYHGNADVERGFSLSGRIVTNETASMSERTLNSKLHVMNGVKLFYNGNPQEVHISQSMLISAKLAHSNYINYLEKERHRKLEENNKNQQIQEEQKLLHEKKEKEHHEIKNLEKELLREKAFENEKSVALDKLLNVAQTTITAATDKGGSIAYADAITLKALIVGANDLKQKQNEQHEATQTIETKVSKRKSSLITSFFKNPSKIPRISK